MKATKAKILAIIIISVITVSTLQALLTPFTYTYLIVDVRYNSHSISEYKSMEEATVTLFDDSQKPVRSEQTTSGQVSFQMVPNGHYTLSVSWLWFSRSSSVQLSGWSQTVTVDLATSSLAPPGPNLVYVVALPFPCDGISLLLIC